jgi:hypothetical protein
MAFIRSNNYKSRKLRCNDIEIAMAYYFGKRQNFIVPNVSWGLFNHECDLIKLTPSLICTEVEIKISIADLKKDMGKKHEHKDIMIHELYFAIPDYLKKGIEFIPERAGIFIINSKSQARHLPVECIRRAERNIRYKWTIEDKIKLLRLSTMRIWSLKEKLNEEYRKRDKLFCL